MHPVRLQRCEANGVACLQSGDRRVLTAAAEIVRKGLAKVTLLGDPDVVSQDADRLGVDLSGVNVIDHMVCTSHLPPNRLVACISSITCSPGMHVN